MWSSEMDCAVGIFVFPMSSNNSVKILDFNIRLEQGTVNILSLQLDHMDMPLKMRPPAVGKEFEKKKTFWFFSLEVGRGRATKSQRNIRSADVSHAATWKLGNQFKNLQDALENYPKSPCSNIQKKKLPKDEEEEKEEEEEQQEEESWDFSLL